MAHLTAKRITPEDMDPAQVLFDVPMIPLPGRVIVCMYPAREKSDGGILLEGQESAVGSKYQPDFGVVASSGVSELKRGDIVGVKPYDGMWINHTDADWVPEKRQVRIYKDSDSIEIKVEMAA